MSSSIIAILHVSHSNLQICRVIDLTHGHRHCDYYTIVKVMGRVRPRTVKPRTEWPVPLRIPSEHEKDRSGDVGDKWGDGDRGRSSSRVSRSGPRRMVMRI